MTIKKDPNITISLENDVDHVAALPLAFSSNVAASTFEPGQIALLLAETPTERKVLDILLEKPAVVGRHPHWYECTIVTLAFFDADLVSQLRIPHTTVSQQHFEIYSVEFDKSLPALVYCKDTSRNGTYHNGRLIGFSRSHLLSDGDTLDIRHACRFSFRQPGAKLVEDLRKLASTDYVLTSRILGAGTYGKVHLALQKRTNNQLACKITDINKNHHAERNSTEADLLRKLHHPNVIKIFETVQQDNTLYIFQEMLVGGDLFSYVCKDGVLHALPGAEALFFIFQLIKGLTYLHSMEIVHRDLKLDNVLLATCGPVCRLVLIDFGVAKAVRSSKRMHTIVGTPEYCAPEVCMGNDAVKGEKISYDSACDVWSLGVIAHILLSGLSPFYDTDDDAHTMAEKAKRGQLHFDTSEWDSVSPNAKDFVQLLVQVDPKKRLKLGECLSHPWIEPRLPELESLYNDKVENEWPASKITK